MKVESCYSSRNPGVVLGERNLRLATASVAMRPITASMFVSACVRQRGAGVGGTLPRMGVPLRSGWTEIACGPTKH